MKNVVLGFVSIAALMTVPLAANAAEPGDPAPQMKEFHFNRAPKYPNPMAGRAGGRCP